MMRDKVFEGVISELPEFVTVQLVSEDEAIANYTEKNFNKIIMPDVIADMRCRRTFR